MAREGFGHMLLQITSKLDLATSLSELAKRQDSAFSAAYIGQSRIGFIQGGETGASPCRHNTGEAGNQMASPTSGALPSESVTAPQHVSFC